MLFGIGIICMLLLKISSSLANIAGIIEKQTEWISIANKNICGIYDTLKATETHSEKIKDELCNIYSLGGLNYKAGEINDGLRDIANSLEELKDEVSGIKGGLVDIDNSLGGIKDEVGDIKDKLPDVDC